MSKKITVVAAGRSYIYRADRFEIEQNEDTGSLEILGFNHENDIIVAATFAARRWELIERDDEKLQRGWEIWERCQTSHTYINSAPDMGIDDMGEHVIHSEDTVADGRYRWSLAVERERIPELIALLGTAYADSAKETPNA